LISVEGRARFRPTSAGAKPVQDLKIQHPNPNSPLSRIVAEERALVGAVRNECAERLRQGESGRALCRRLTNAADRAVRRLAQAALPASLRTHVVVAATGGYGRRELAPASDLDVWCLCRNDASADPAIARFERALWDASLRPSLLVLPPSAFTSLLHEDLPALTASLFLRRIIGAADVFALFTRLRDERLTKATLQILRRLTSSVTRCPLEALRALQAVEPDVKTSPFMLRGIHRIEWIRSVVRTAGIPMEPQNLLDEEDALQAARDLFLRVRWALHVLAGRNNNLLGLDQQGEVAHMLGFGPPGPTAAEALLRQVYRNEHAVHVRLSYIVERIELRLKRRVPRRAAGTRSRERIGDYLVRINDEIHLSGAPAEIWGPTPTTRDLIEPFRTAVRTGLRVSGAVLGAVREACARIASARDPAPDPEAARAFRQILGQHRPVGAVLAGMYSTGLLRRLLPEYDAVEWLPVFGPWHRFTVDAHSVLTAAAFDDILGGRTPRNLEPYRVLLFTGCRLDVLRFAALMHDVGKGMEGDHSVTGAAAARSRAALLGFPPDAAESAARLVREHLLLSSASIRRDVEAPETLQELLPRISDRRFLTELFLLTWADMRSVGTGLLTGWKESQLWQLFQRLSDALHPAATTGTNRSDFPRRLSLYRPRIGDPATADAVRRHVEQVDWPPYRDRTTFETILHHTRLAETHRRDGHEIAVEDLGPHAAAVTVVCDDAPGLFSLLAGAFTGCGLSILAGACYTRRDGIAIDEFTVQDARTGSSPKREQLDELERSLPLVLGGTAAVDDMVRRWKRRFPTLKRPPAVLPEIAVDHASSRYATIVTVRTADHAGLLYDLGRTMEQLGLDIRYVRISTHAGIAEDAFYVVERTGGKIAPHRHSLLIQRLEQAAAEA